MMWTQCKILSKVMHYIYFTASTSPNSCLFVIITVLTNCTVVYQLIMYVFVCVCVCLCMCMYLCVCLLLHAGLYVCKSQLKKHMCIFMLGTKQTTVFIVDKMMVYIHCCEIQVTKTASLIQSASMVEIKFTEFMRITDLQLVAKILHLSSFTNLKKLNP